MPLRTKLFSVAPWKGGLNTSKNESMLAAGQLTKADHISMGTDFSKQRRLGINSDWDDQANGSAAIIGLHDAWFGTSGRSQTLAAVDASEKIYTYTPGTNGGARTDRSPTTGIPWSSGTVTDIQMLTFNNRLLIAPNGTGNVIKQLDATVSIPAEATDLSAAGGTPPLASALAEHLGRVFANDKTDVDRLHYCGTHRVDQWGVDAGDGGAIDIMPGDGDPIGITAIASYRGDLIVFKSTSIYRVTGQTPETFKVSRISDSIGCIGPNAIADIDGNDLVFVSKRGIHSLQATDKFGDLKQAYVSKDIQRSFNDVWSKARLSDIKVVYVPSENSIAFAVTDTQISASDNNAIWWFNIEDQSWYRWPNISCQSIVLSDDTDRQRLYIGTSSTRICQTFTVDNRDIDTAGIDSGVSFLVATGRLDVEKTPFINKSYKSIGLLFEAKGTYSITVTITVDNRVPQVAILSSDNPGDLLGVNFILGASKLGAKDTLSAHMLEVDINGDGWGSGKYIKIQVEMSGASETVDLQGFLIEYEVAGDQKEIINA